MRLETGRLILRPPRKSDWKDIVEGIGDITVSRNLKVVPYPYYKKDALAWIGKSLEHWKQKEKKDCTFMIELKSERKLIGATGLHKINNICKKAETGSWINKKYWRRGYILEAKVPVLDFAFNKLKLNKIETGAFVENIASNRMSLKLGFKEEGIRKRTVVCKATGKIHDENLYGLFKEEWLKTKPKIIKEGGIKIKNDK